ncbi:cytochrome c oxidase subunit 6A1, mitochondrial-like [Dromiciops gliroides]|uniref:cytochrome c oxidase subunit 6A1, mitochondrial-like n=1 Tax=Dromiciops gliroides TaxID=33562 RepID=UPI001CC48EF3|nr:cytochrome c oxidase subunit 6A1, mitochondrial-like [Dromiciops gliroides]
MAVTRGRRVLKFLGQGQALSERTISRGFSMEGSEEGSAHMWKMLTCYVALPSVVVSMLNCYMKSKNHQKKPKFIPYSHLRIRTKPFPWGDGNHTLFHNRQVNPLPTGYEDD